jgi:hypothetical protein
MNNRKATRIELNTRIKSWVGLPYRSLARRSWAMSTQEFWNYQAAALGRMYEFARHRRGAHSRNSGQASYLEEANCKRTQFGASGPPASTLDKVSHNQRNNRNTHSATCNPTRKGINPGDTRRMAASYLWVSQPTHPLPFGVHGTFRFQ